MAPGLATGPGRIGLRERWGDGDACEAKLLVEEFVEGYPTAAGLPTCGGGDPCGLWA